MRNRPDQSMLNRQSGFSMVELMVAMTLGLLLTAAVLQAFVGAKQTYEFQQEFSRIQENGRFAMEFLSRDIRQADYWGCLNDGVKVQSILNGSGGPDDFAAGLFGFDDVPEASTGYHSFFGGQPDAITLQGGRLGGIPVISTPSDSAANIKLDILNHPNGKAIDEGDILLVTDCTEAVIFQVTNTQGANNTVVHQTGTQTPGNSQQGLDYSFGPDATVLEVSDIRYWIRKGVSGEPALIRGTRGDDWQTGGIELVEGVENLQILYGEDTSGNGSPNRFASASSSIDMADVVSVQIHLVTRSLRDNLRQVDDAHIEDLLVDYNGGPKSSNDRRLRKVFMSTIAIRNRLD
ncbi:MAG: PilW family protein [Motiliproteus sp.]